MRHCTGIWGNAAINTDPLRTVVVENAVYMPFSESVWFEHQHDWGIFTDFGQIVEQSVFYRGISDFRPSQARSIDLSGLEIVDAPFPEMVYGGPIHPHYGHFLMTSLARLYACDGSMPVLVHSHPDIFDHGLPFVRNIVAAAHWTPRNCASSMQPMRVRRLHVPEPAIVEQERIATGIRPSLLALGNQFECTKMFNGGRFYFSKSKLSGGIGGLDEESVVEDAFRRVGFEIIYPEMISLDEQVSLFKGAAAVSGTVSSAFHTLILAPESEARRIIFGYGDHINANFQLVDHIASGRSYYMSMQGDIIDIKRDGFLSYYKAKNIEKLATSMAKVAHEISRI